MKKAVIMWLFLCGILGLCLSPVSAKEPDGNAVYKCIYVSASGSNANSGTEESPLLTFEAAHQQSPDKIILMNDISVNLGLYQNLPIIEGYTGNEKRRFLLLYPCREI